MRTNKLHYYTISGLIAWWCNGVDGKPCGSTVSIWTSRAIQGQRTIILVIYCATFSAWTQIFPQTRFVSRISFETIAYGSDWVDTVMLWCTQSPRDRWVNPTTPSKRTYVSPTTWPTFTFNASHVVQSNWYCHHSDMFARGLSLKPASPLTAGPETVSSNLLVGVFLAKVLMGSDVALAFTH